MITFDVISQSTVDSPQGTYHYDFSRVGSNLALISSDDRFRILDPGNLMVYSISSQTHSDGVTCLKTLDENTVVTAGRDGKAKVWDLRTGVEKAVGVFGKGNGSPILSLEVSKERSSIAVGTELTGQTAEIVVWDLNGNIVKNYVESHNDDVTQLSFHPTERNLLLSGSTDGLINIYNLTIEEEDDALHQVINHGSSIHHAGFLNSNAIYGLSHDENLAVYKLADPDDEVVEPSPVTFGDVREKLKCDYAIDVLVRGGEMGVGIFAVGSHSQKWLDMYSLKSDPVWNLGEEDVVRLRGAHGEEIVRCVYVDDATSTIFTGGEDGLVKIWKPN